LPAGIDLVVMAHSGIHGAVLPPDDSAGHAAGTSLTSTTNGWYLPSLRLR
jgi:hypothetical protein